MSLEDIITPIETLVKVTCQALNDSQQSLNSEVSLMRKALPTNRRRLCQDPECCVFRPNESANALSLVNHVGTQVNALSDPTASLEDLICGSDDGVLGGKN